MGYIRLLITVTYYSTTFLGALKMSKNCSAMNIFNTRKTIRKENGYNNMNLMSGLDESIETLRLLMWDNVLLGDIFVSHSIIGTSKLNLEMLFL